ncbi:MAG TPA: tetratricopeptide repeat protein [Candidatus Omnitrophota bacterium]|nr:tetratricopeptide repeat protein [Candidatus Omnitrophota bacterium]
MPQEKRVAHILPVLVLIILGILSYSNTFNASFQLDDGHAIVGNPAIKDLKDLHKIWAYDTTRFLTYLSFAVNYHFGKLNTFGYHLINLIIHLCTSIVVYILAQLVIARANVFKKQKESRNQLFAICAALAFLLHPIQTSAVTYVVQRAALLATFFYVLTLTLYILFTLTKKAPYYLLALLAAFLGIFSKPLIMTLPLSLALYEICFPQSQKEPLKNRLCRLTPFFLMMLLVPGILILWKYQTIDLEKLFEISKETTAYSRKEYFLTQINVLVTYVRLLVLPINQNFDYDFPIARSFFTYPTWACASFLMALAALGVKLFKKHALVSFSIFWFFITLSAESSIFPISDVIFEHRLYLPMVGFSLLVAYLLVNLIQKRGAALGALGVLVIVYAGASFARNKVWHDPFSLWSDVLKTPTKKSRPYIYLGNVHLERKEYDKALAHFNRAIELNPQSAKTYNNRGLAHLAKQMMTQAVADFQRAIEVEPKYLDAYSNLGNAYQLMGRFEEAIGFYEKALLISPKHISSLNNLAQAYLQTGDFAKAIESFQRVLSLKPESAEAHFNLGNACQRGRRLNEAVSHYQRSVELDPRYTDAYYNLGIVYSQLNRSGDAMSAYEKAIGIDPGHMRSRNNLAVILYQLGKYDEAIRQVDAAIQGGYAPNPEFLQLINRHRQ